MRLRSWHCDPMTIRTLNLSSEPHLHTKCALVMSLFDSDIKPVSCFLPKVIQRRRYRACSPESSIKGDNKLGNLFLNTARYLAVLKKSVHCYLYNFNLSHT